jgi:hypothetical protein
MKRHWSEEIWESPPRSTTIRITAVGMQATWHARGGALSDVHLGFSTAMTHQAK